MSDNGMAEASDATLTVGPPPGRHCPRSRPVANSLTQDSYLLRQRVSQVIERKAARMSAGAARRV